MKQKRHGSRGIALMVVMELLMVVFVVSIAFLANNDNNLIVLAQEKEGTQAFYVADSAAQQAMRDLDDRITTLASPTGFALLDSLYNNTTRKDDITYIDPTTLSTQTVGSYTVAASIYPAAGSAPFLIAKGTTTPPPRPGDPPPPAGFTSYKVVTFNVTAVSGAVSRQITVKAIAGLRVSGETNDTFNFSYFMNDFGWFAGGTSQMFMNGNTGANGDFNVISDESDPFSGALTVNGAPYVGLDGKVTDGSTIYASGTVSGPITGSDATIEQNGSRKNFPNLNNLGYYKQLALAQGGTITQNGSTLVNGVFSGGTPAENNIVLDGTKNPITINGPVVVDGNVVIKGSVSGNGTLYVGKNLYVAGDVTYANGTSPSLPPTYDPSSMTQDQYANALAAWRNTYESSKYSQVTYAVRQNVVYGDVTAQPGTSLSGDTAANDQNNDNSQSPAANWWGTVSQSMSLTVNGESINNGHEDAGLDKIWTSGDAKENDGKWTVSVLDPSSGGNVLQDFSVVNGSAQIPSGTTVLPGSGEDAVGDGQYHGVFTYQDFAGGVMDRNGSATFDSHHYADFPSDPSMFPYPNTSNNAYSSYADSVNHVDGFVMANGAIAGINGDWRGKYTVSGTFTDPQTGQVEQYTALKPTDVVTYGGEVGRTDLMLTTGAGYTSDSPVMPGQSYHNIWYHDPRFGDAANPINVTLPVVAAMAVGSWDEPDVAK